MPIESVVVMVIGLAGGLAVGGGFVAFLTVLGVIPRMTQLTKTQRLIHYYVLAIISRNTVWDMGKPLLFFL